MNNRNTQFVKVGRRTVAIRLLSFRAHNFKSLRQVNFTPQEVSMVIGPNAGGKSNLLRGLDFMGDVLGSGLENALTRHGGPQAIWYRNASGEMTSEPLRLAVTLEVSTSKGKPPLTVGYSIELIHQEGGDVAPVRVTKEVMTFQRGEQPPVEISRGKNGILKLPGADRSGEFLDVSFPMYYLTRRDPGETSRKLDHDITLWQFLMYPGIMGATPGTSGLFKRVSLFPVIARQPGLPIHAATLGTAGESLPAVIRWLKIHHSERFEALKDFVRELVPTLQDLAVDETYDRRWALKVQDQHGDWITEDVSDGTLMVLALGVALYDPRYDMVMIEEIENCLHPWIVRRIMNRIRKMVSAPSGKQVIITTHSTLVLNEASPHEIWVAFRTDKATHVRPITRLKRANLEKLDIGDYLDFGGITEWLPPSGGER